MNIKDQLDQAKVNTAIDKCLSNLQINISAFDRSNYISIDNEPQEFKVSYDNNNFFIAKENAIEKAIEKIIDKQTIRIYEKVYGSPDYGDINPEIPPEHIEYKKSKVAEIATMLTNNLDKVLGSSFDNFSDIKNSLLADRNKGNEELEL